MDVYYFCRYQLKYILDGLIFIVLIFFLIHYTDALLQLFYFHRYPMGVHVSHGVLPFEFWDDEKVKRRRKEEMDLLKDRKGKVNT